MRGKKYECLYQIVCLSIEQMGINFTDENSGKHQSPQNSFSEDYENLYEMVIHHIVATLQSGPKWWTKIRQTDRHCPRANW